MEDNRIKIGNSDFTREEMEKGVYGWGISAEIFLETIKFYESEGYKVNFETSFWQRIFGIAKYKITATKIFNHG